MGKAEPANAGAAGPSRQKSFFTPKIANTLYSSVLLLMLYDWPHQVYQKLGPRMGQTTVREHLIVEQFQSHVRRLHLSVRPTFVVGPVPASAGAFSGNAIIVISSAMLDPAKFSDNDVRFIVAHEAGHIARLDVYRFWTRWTRGASEAREIDADKIAVRLVGCAPMVEAITHHWDEFMKGYRDDSDHHPHPSDRLRAACPLSRAKVSR
jgi:Zn-dependent protease with chaperone function